MVSLDALSLHAVLRDTLPVHHPPVSVRLSLAKSNPVACRETLVDARIAPDAIACMQRLADENATLTLPSLLAVQSLVLGTQEPVSLRSTHAWGRGGAHWYRAMESFPLLVCEWLAKWNTPTLDPCIAACGVYYDIVFSHPFEDGNARAARLWSAFVLRRAQRALPNFDDLVRTCATPGDARCFWRSVQVIANAGNKRILHENSHVTLVD